MVALSNSHQAQTVVVDDVTPVSITPGLSVLDRWGVTPGVRESFDLDYPGAVLEGRLRPIAGFVVPAQTGPGAKPGQYTAAIGLRASSPGAYEIREVRIHYHVGTERYEIVVPEYARICAVTGDPLKTDCALPKTD